MTASKTAAAADTRRPEPRCRGSAALLAIVVAAVLATACAPLVSIKPLEGSFSADPLPPDELQLRISSRLYSDDFSDRVRLAADRIADLADDPAIREAALRWKIAANSASLRAGRRIPGQLALVDSWTLARQMEEFLKSGAGSPVFGPHQSIAVGTAGELAREIEQLADRHLKPAARDAYRELVESYVARAPFAGLDFSRPPITGEWSVVAQRVDGVPKTIGAASEVLADATDRADAYGRRVPEELRWRGELYLARNEDSIKALSASFAKMDEELGKIALVAREQPDRAWIELEKVRKDVDRLVVHADRRWAETLWLLRTERAALSKDLQETRAVLDAAFERERAALSVVIDQQRTALTETFDRQRTELTTDGERIAKDLSTLWIERARAAVRDVLAFVGLFFLLLFGIAFGLGYVAGGLRGRRAARREVPAAVAAPAPALAAAPAPAATAPPPR